MHKTITKWYFLTTIKIKKSGDDRAPDEKVADEGNSFESETQDSVAVNDENEHREDDERDDQNQGVVENASSEADAQVVLETTDDDSDRQKAHDFADTFVRQDYTWTAAEEYADEPFSVEAEDREL